MLSSPSNLKGCIVNFYESIIIILNNIIEDPVVSTKSKPVQRMKKSGQGHNCCVPDCHNCSGDPKKQDELGNVSYHSFPDVNSAKGKQWLQRIRRDPGTYFVINSHTKVCSEHFAPDDFISGNLLIKDKRRRLKQNAVPSIFPWRPVKKRLSITSRKAMQSLSFERPEQQSTKFVESDSIITDSVEPESYCDFSDMETDSTELKIKLTQTEEKLAEAERRLAETERKLVETERKLAVTQASLSVTENKLAVTEKELNDSLFRIRNLKHDDSLVKFYTGLPCYSTLSAFFEEILKHDASLMRQWSGRRSTNDYDDIKVGASCNLPLEEQLFLTLVRLRLGLLERDLACRFKISQATVSRITCTWINLMYRSFKSIETFPSWNVVKKYMPEAFRKDYPNTRIIIDATEFFIERPSSLVSQSSTFSSYKNRNTVKVLIGITPSGAISFVSEAYEGSISDRKLVEVCGLLEKLEPGDEVMADKGFTIQDLLVPFGVRLNMPPFLQSNTQMPASDVFTTKKIARLRVHVERAIGRVKDYRLLQGSLPASMWDSISDTIYVCCMLTNFGPPLVC